MDTKVEVGLYNAFGGESALCAFCNSATDDQKRFGQKLDFGNATAHLYCLILSTNIKRNDDETYGLMGYLSEDIAAEVKRASDVQCVYCRLNGATITCCRLKCRKSFHLPCAMENNCDFDINDPNRTYCDSHSSPSSKKFTSTIDDTEAEMDEQKNKPQRTRVCWSHEKTFANRAEALEAVKNEKAWSKYFDKNSKAGHRVRYRCNLVKSRGKQCAAGIYLLYDTRSPKVHLFRSDSDHTHDSLVNARKAAFSPATKAAIIEMYEIGIKPKWIIHNMIKRGLKAPSEKALAAFLQKLRSSKMKQTDDYTAPVTRSSRNVSSAEYGKEPKKEFICNDTATDSTSRLNTTDNESNDDSVGDFTHVETCDMESLEENSDLLNGLPPKRRKPNDSTEANISVPNLSTDYLVTNSNSIASTSATNHDWNKGVPNSSNADEKWWQAQYGYYLRMTKKQQFKMKKMMSELQLEFEYENLENAAPETTQRNVENVTASADAGDPLEVNPPWW